MHELSVCQSMISQVEGIAADREAQSVASITISIGALSGVDSQLLMNAYTIASAGTIAEHAELIIEHNPIRVRCNRCGGESEALANKMVCQECGDWRTTLISGDELLLMSVELVKTDDAPAEMVH
jgi:hydrogenase nickel incorporation protein HypA/HybF